jgi:hypothetical protein
MSSFAKRANPPGSVFAQSPDQPQPPAQPVTLPYSDHEPPYVWLAFAAVAVYLTVPANLLYICGISYDAPGGSPLSKLHPGTYLLLIAFAIKLWKRRTPMADFAACVQKNPAAMFFLAMIGISMVLAMLLSSGVSGAAVFLDNFVAAVLVVLILDDASERVLQRLGYLMLGLFGLNAAISVTETLLHQTLVPPYIGGELLTLDRDEFRGSGLYEHPLTGAAMTMMAIFLLLAVPGRSVLKWSTFMLFIMGLISFGGRSALLLTTVILAVWGTLVFLVRGLSGQLQFRELVLALLAAIAVPAFGLLIITQTSIGERLMSHLFWDESAGARVVQWQVLSAMDLKELLFGASFDRLQDVKFQISLQLPLADIENCWLLLFVNMGIIGFLFFAAGLGAFLIHLLRRSPLPGRLLLIALLVLASSSNSLGRKCDLLTIGVAAVLAMASFRQRRELEEGQQLFDEGPHGPSVRGRRVFAEHRHRPANPIKA